MTGTLDAGVDDKPKMTAAESDARFAALVAEHRGSKKKSRATAVDSRGWTDRAGTVALVLVFCFGVVAGAIFHVKPLLAIILGAPTVFFAHVLYKRSRDRLDAP